MDGDTPPSGVTEMVVWRRNPHTFWWLEMVCNENMGRNILLLPCVCYTIFLLSKQELSLDYIMSKESRLSVNQRIIKKYVKLISFLCYVTSSLKLSEFGGVLGIEPKEL